MAGSRARLQDQFGLLERIALTEVPQELKEPDVPWQGEFTDPTEHPQVGLEQRKQALRAILMHLATCIFLLRMIDELVHVALHRPIAAARVGVEPPTRSHRTEVVAPPLLLVEGTSVLCPSAPRADHTE